MSKAGSEATTEATPSEGTEATGGNGEVGAKATLVLSWAASA